METRILHAVAAMNQGGIENFIMNIYRMLDRDVLQFDFLYHYAAPSVFDEEIEALGGRIYRFPVRENNRVFSYCSQLDQFFSQHTEYSIIHGHYSGFGMFYNHYAKKHGIHTRIGHSHSTSTEKNLTGFFDAGMSRFFRYGVTDCFACSLEAGKYLFGNRPVQIVPNAIDTAAFAYNEPLRLQTRKSLSIKPGQTVYGHVGRFAPAKNHKFVIDIFNQILKQQPEAILLLIGEGELEQKCRNQCRSLGIESKVRFLGNRLNVNEFYMAMDCFLFPSFFEGLGIVAVEAQAAGLPCFISDVIPAEVQITPLITSLPLSLSAEEWALKILSHSLSGNRTGWEKQICQKGYGSAQQADFLTEFYLNHSDRKAAD